MKKLLVIFSLTITFALGWFANHVLQTQKAYGAAAGRTYKVEKIREETFESLLNTLAQQGWIFHSAIIGSGGAAAVFER